MKRYSHMTFALALSIFTVGFTFADTFMVNLTRGTLDQNPFGKVCVEDISYSSSYCRLNAEVMVASNIPGVELMVVQPGTWIELASISDARSQPDNQQALIQPVDLPEIVIAAVSETSIIMASSNELMYTSHLEGE